MINILLVENHQLVRKGIKMLLESHKSIRVTSEADNGKDALARLEKEKSINMVISDINMEDGIDGVILTEKIKTLYPEIKVILLSMNDNYQCVSQCFKKGAEAYLIKNIDYKELVFSILHVARGGKYICEDIMMGMLNQIQDFKPQENLIRDLELSNREMEVLLMIGDGFTNHEIADKLFLSKRTVEGHRQNLIDKMHAKNSAQLVKYAVKYGLM